MIAFASFAYSVHAECNFIIIIIIIIMCYWFCAEYLQLYEVWQ